MPKIYADHHDTWMRRFFIDNRSTVMNMDRKIFVLSRSGFIVPCNLIIKVSPSLAHGLQVVGVFSIQSDHSTHTAILLIDGHTGMVSGVSEGAHLKYSLRSPVERTACDVPHLFPHLTSINEIRENRSSLQLQLLDISSQNEAEKVPPQTPQISSSYQKKDNPFRALLEEHKTSPLIRKQDSRALSKHNGKESSTLFAVKIEPRGIYTHGIEGLEIIEIVLRPPIVGITRPLTRKPTSKVPNPYRVLAGTIVGLTRIVTDPILKDGSGRRQSLGNDIGGSGTASRVGGRGVEREKVQEEYDVEMNPEAEKERRLKEFKARLKRETISKNVLALCCIYFPIVVIGLTTSATLVDRQMRRSEVSNAGLADIQELGKRINLVGNVWEKTCLGLFGIDNKDQLSDILRLLGQVEESSEESLGRLNAGAAVPKNYSLMTDRIETISLMPSEAIALLINIAEASLWDTSEEQKQSTHHFLTANIFPQLFTEITQELNTTQANILSEIQSLVSDSVQTSILHFALSLIVTVLCIWRVLHLIKRAKIGYSYLSLAKKQDLEGLITAVNNFKNFTQTTDFENFNEPVVPAVTQFDNLKDLQTEISLQKKTAIQPIPEASDSDISPERQSIRSRKISPRHKSVLHKEMPISFRSNPSNFGMRSTKDAKKSTFMPKGANFSELSSAANQPPSGKLSYEDIFTINKIVAMSTKGNGNEYVEGGKVPGWGNRDRQVMIERERPLARSPKKSLRIKPQTTPLPQSAKKPSAKYQKIALQSASSDKNSLIQENDVKKQSLIRGTFQIHRRVYFMFLASLAFALPSLIPITLMDISSQKVHQVGQALITEVNSQMNLISFLMAVLTETVYHGEDLHNAGLRQLSTLLTDNLTKSISQTAFIEQNMLGYRWSRELPNYMASRDGDLCKLRRVATLWLRPNEKCTDFSQGRGGVERAISHIAMEAKRLAMGGKEELLESNIESFNTLSK